MKRPRPLWRLRVLSAAALLPFLMTPTPADTHCAKRDSWTGCKSYTDFSVYHGQPTVICPTGHPVVQIETTAVCGGLVDGTALALRCGTNSVPFSYTGFAYMHTFGTVSNWETVLGGACGDLTYSAIAW